MARRKRLDASFWGIVITTAVAIVCVSGVVVLLLRGPGEIGSHSPDDREPAPDIRTLGRFEPSDDPGVVSGRDLTIQLTSEHDPTTLVGIMHFGSLDPEPNRRYRATQASAWLFLESGEFLHVQAPDAQLVMPDGKRPESGSLRGGVQIDLYDPPASRRQPDPAIDEAKLRAVTPVLHFNLSIGEVSAPRELLVETDDVEFVGRDMTARFNEGQQRIDYLEIRRGEQITYHPMPDERTRREARAGRTRQLAQAGERPPAGRPAGAAPPEGGADAAAEPPAPKRFPQRTHYHLRFKNDVLAAQGAAHVRADQLDVWVRMIDNALPEGAIGGQAMLGAPSRVQHAVLGGGSFGDALVGGLAAGALAATPALPSAAQQGRRFGDGEEPVVLTWNGPMVMRPLEAVPDELRGGNHVALRFSAAERGLVTISDPSRGASGRCATLDYAATRRELDLRGPGPSSVRLAQEGSGSLETHRLRMDLARGVVTIPGPGVAHALEDDRPEPDPSRPRRLSWTEQAAFQFAMRDGRMTGALEQAELSGRVEAVQESARLAGRTIRATFYPPDAADRADIRSLDVEGPVEAADGSGGMLLGSRLHVDFRPPTEGRRSDPEAVTVEGDAMVRREDATLRAGLIDAFLGRGAEGGLEVKFVSARDDVRFADSAADIAATADRLRANAELQLADLEGREVTVSQGPDVITGTQVHLNGADRVVEVFGSGAFERRAGEGRPPLAVASWSKQMVFDDRKGSLDCFGEAMARWQGAELAVDDVTAERLRVELTPQQAAPEGERAPLGTDGREVQRVIASGMAMFEAGGAPAVAQSIRERIDPESGERVIDTLLRLEARELRLLDRTQRLVVEHPGRLLVADYRTDPSQAEGDPESMRGSALFTWEGTLLGHRPSGTLEMRRNVQMTHVRQHDGQRSHLLCELLEAGFATGGAEASSDEAGSLRRVVASGAVYLRSGDHELAADRLVYDAPAAIAEATSETPGGVTFFDATRPAPVSAMRLWWDLRHDRIEIRRPQPVSAPD